MMFFFSFPSTADARRVLQGLAHDCDRPAGQGLCRLNSAALHGTPPNINSNFIASVRVIMNPGYLPDPRVQHPPRRYPSPRTTK